MAAQFSNFTAPLTQTVIGKARAHTATAFEAIDHCLRGLSIHLLVLLLHEADLKVCGHHSNMYLMACSDAVPTAYLRVAMCGCLLISRQSSGYEIETQGSVALVMD